MNHTYTIRTTASDNPPTATAIPVALLIAIGTLQGLVLGWLIWG